MGESRSVLGLKPWGKLRKGERGIGMLEGGMHLNLALQEDPLGGVGLSWEELLVVVVVTVALISLAGVGEAIAPARSCEKDLHSESGSWSEKKELARVIGPGLMLLRPMLPSGRGGRAKGGREGAGLVSNTPPPPSLMAMEDLLSLPSMEP